jgi:CDP-paratose 2-epimerase
MITGGAGFIGANTARRLMGAGHQVTVLDNLSRKGCQANLDWLRGEGDFAFVQADIRDSRVVEEAISRGEPFDAIIHLAGQVAVTSSVIDPREDFEINALGTLNILEAARLCPEPPIILFSSTNKVYGGLEDVEVAEGEQHYRFVGLPFGVGESRCLDFHSPYGCSKGAADQYVRDYSRIYGLRTVVLRQSCIYGYRQFGVEDQGWVAWFLIASALGKPITVYGDGKQVRDILFVEDLVDAYEQSIAAIDRTQGCVYNIGGGPDNQMSLLELLAHIETLSGRAPEVSFAGWRPGDQRVFVSDIRKAREEMGWTPKTDTVTGIVKLYQWIQENLNLLARMF